MTRNWMATLVVAGGLGAAAFGQSYPPEAYDNGQYGGYDPNYDNSGVYAPAPPPMPSYAYNRPPMPGPGYYWVDGYWNFVGGRYIWVAGYWMTPPYAGGYWVAPRYTGGRFFFGFWGGARPAYGYGYRGGYGQVYVQNNYRYSAPRPMYRDNYSHGYRGGYAHGGGHGHYGGRR